MSRVDRKRVSKAFGCGAERYDRLAVVQQRVVETFINRNFSSNPVPATMLDVGVGTGLLLEQLLRINPDAQATGLDLAFGMARVASRRLNDIAGVAMVCGDGERLPFSDGSFDLVVSTSTYQWLHPADRAFTEVWRVLRPGGRFCFSLFGDGTLVELLDSYRTALAVNGCTDIDRSHRFATSDVVMDSLNRIGFDHTWVSCEVEVEMHSDVTALLRSLKGIGAGNASGSRPPGLAGRRVTAAMIDIYARTYGGDAGIPATYAVIYGGGQKPIV